MPGILVRGAVLRSRPQQLCSLAAVTEHIDPDEIGIGIVLQSNEAYSTNVCCAPPVLWSLVRGFCVTTYLHYPSAYLNPEPPSFPLQLTGLTDISPLRTPYCRYRSFCLLLVLAA